MKTLYLEVLPIGKLPDGTDWSQLTNLSDQQKQHGAFKTGERIKVVLKVKDSHFRFGREPENELHLGKSAMNVSRVHATISQREDGEYEFRDHSSRGSILGETKLSQTTQRIVDGQILTLPAEDPVSFRARFVIVDEDCNEQDTGKTQSGLTSPTQVG